MHTKPKCRFTDILVQTVGSELLIYDLTIDKAFCLNETSSLIYRLADGTRTIREISDSMSKNLKTLVSEDFVLLALLELEKENLLEERFEMANSFSHFSRREMVRKVGFASMIALPVVATMIAPTSANAASCTDLQPGQQFGSTIRPAQCIDGTCPTVCSNLSSNCCSNSAFANACTDLSGLPPSIQCDCTCA